LARIFKGILRAVARTALLILGMTAALSAANRERTAVWVVRDQIETAAQIDQIIAFASQWELTDLFIQVRGRGDACYRSRLSPFAEYLSDKQFDPLEYILQRARPRGIRIHAWLNIYILWSAEKPPSDPRHLVHTRPDWISVDANGQSDRFKTRSEFQASQSEGMYLSPLARGVNEHLLAVIAELLERYEVDGVHLDYVRYPAQRYDYHLDGRMAFKTRLGVDPILLSISNKTFFEGWELRVIDSLTICWNDFRREAINRFIADCRQLIETQGRPIELSAAVKPDPFEARNHFYQDWPLWLKNGWLDFAVPMNYTRQTESFEATLEKIRLVASATKIWMGIGAYNQSRYDAMTKTMVSRSYGFGNVVYFSYKEVAAAHYFATLRKAFGIPIPSAK